ncbi:citrate lyase acyl carrier protein [Peptoniphilus equinus]|uniref:Citrate lyase acyl carrier protein n=1 Tax=Peptoniphilus equinus TaxID=3016343 RepID=A0ABY7QSD9_9FIRM|nr:citrate lyase acyl carrier protein [Peptoniphilus equinus]WBW49662.1 citrate lyase acyl carrier protein [Peptoniphilus equinus]
MELKKKAVAGTLESSDAKVTVEPADTLTVDIESSVMAQFGVQIREAVEDVLARLEVTGANVKVEDKGALDCTLRARVETAVFRSVDKTTDIPWEVM